MESVECQTEWAPVTTSHSTTQTIHPHLEAQEVLEERREEWEREKVRPRPPFYFYSSFPIQLQSESHSESHSESLLIMTHDSSWFL